MGETLESRWLVFVVAGQRCALNISDVLELNRHDAHAMVVPPGMPAVFRGVMEIRSTLTPVLDLRVALGHPSLEEETSAIQNMLEQRREDHVRWINELEASVREQRPFTLATDPHQCAFGRWYDTIMADEAELDKLTNGNTSMRHVLQRALRAFDEPHQRIHAVATDVVQLLEEGRADKALERIELTRATTLNSMLTLFDRFFALIRKLRKSLVVILERHGQRLGVIVDSVHIVREIDPAAVVPPPAGVDASGLVAGVAPAVETVDAAAGGEQREVGAGELTLLLDAEELFRQHVHDVVQAA